MVSILDIGINYTLLNFPNLDNGINIGDSFNSINQRFFIKIIPDQRLFYEIFYHILQLNIYDKTQYERLYLFKKCVTFGDE
jgi:hypothetical protein